MTVIRNGTTEPEPTPEPTSLDDQVAAEFAPPPAPDLASVPPPDDQREDATLPAAGESGERVEGPETTPQPPPVPSAEPVDQTSLPDHYDILGRQITPAQAEAMFNVYAWAQALTTEQVIAIEQVLAGDTGAPAGPERQPPAPAPAAASPTAPAPAPPTDPYEDPAITAMRAEIDQLRAQVAAPQVAQPQPNQPPPFDAQLHAHRVAVAQDVMGSAQETLGLNEAEAELIAQRIIQSGELGPLENQYGDFRAAMERAVQSQVWLDPFFREKAISAQAPKMNGTATATAERKAASSSLASSTGSAPRESDQSPAPSTRQAQIDAMAKEIARDMQAG